MCYTYVATFLTPPSLQDCPHSPWSYVSSSCSSGGVAGVKCNGTVTSIRLTQGTTQDSGVVQVLHQGVWGTICSGGFGYFDAKVICADLGYPGVLSWGTAPHALTSNKTTPIWLNYLACTGNEYSLNQCYKQEWGVSYCYSESVAVVNCSTSAPVEGDIQIALMDGTGDTNGRVEIKLHGIWGTVCSTYYNGQLNLARVICHELGFDTQNPLALARESYDVTGVDQPIHYTAIYCTGEETSISECYNETEIYSYQQCTHKNDLYVECDTSKHCPALVITRPLMSDFDGTTVPLGESSLSLLRIVIYSSSPC